MKKEIKTTVLSIKKFPSSLHNKVKKMANKNGLTIQEAYVHIAKEYFK